MILSSLSTSSIQTTEKKLRVFFNKILIYHFPFYDVYCVWFAAYKLVNVLAWVS